MKKLFIVLVLVIFSGQCMADDLLSDIFDFGEEKASDAIDLVKKCPITNDTPITKISRPVYEMGAVFNVFDFPAGGDAQARIENINLSLIINLGPTFHAYAWTGSRNTRKNKYTYQEDMEGFDEEWSSTMIFAGFGLYLVPKFRIFAGAGQVTMENTQGEVPSLNTGIEYGAGWSEDFYGNRLEITYKAIIAGVSGDDVPVEQSVASGSHNSISIGLYFPIGGE